MGAYASFPHQQSWQGVHGMYNQNCCVTGGAVYPSGHQAPSYAVPFSYVPYTYTPPAMPTEAPVESVQPQQQPQPVQVGTYPIQVPYAPPAGSYCGFGMGGGFGSMGAGYGNNNYSPYYSTYPSGYSAGGYGYYGGYGYGMGGYNYGGRY